MQKSIPGGRGERPRIRPEAAKSESEESRVWAHLTHRQRLSTIEERVLDRDGDGRVTSRDLYLAQTDSRLTPMPEIVPTTRIVTRGETQELDILGPTPKGLAVQLRTRDRLQRLDVEIKRTKRRNHIAIRLPEDVESGDRVEADLWLTAPGYTPRCIGLVFAKRPVRVIEPSPRAAEPRRHKKGDAR